MRRIFIITSAFLCIASAAWADIFGKPFSDGSPACTSCHSVAAAGYRVSAWGPDISGLYEDMGGDASAIADFVRESGIGPMDAVYADMDIPAEEIEALAEAYAALSPEQASVTGGGDMVLYSFIIFILLMIAGRAVFRNNSQLEENK